MWAIRFAPVFHHLGRKTKYRFFFLVMDVTFWTSSESFWHALIFSTCKEMQHVKRYEQKRVHESKSYSNNKYFTINFKLLSWTLDNYNLFYLKAYPWILIFLYIVTTQLHKRSFFQSYKCSGYLSIQDTLYFSH